jgi:transcriptional regulator GlxA family with amidase domain
MPGVQIDILLFDGFDELDAIAPYEVLRTAAQLGADVQAELVGAYGAATITASHGTRIVVARGPSDTADAVLVPGGGWFGDAAAGARAEAERGDLPALLGRAGERGALITSVCTGAMLLAAAGLTRGRPATTHHDALGDLRASGALVAEQRVVDDGDLVTAGGVTAGLDLALRLVERVAGADAATAVAREIEYEPRP